MTNFVNMTPHSVIILDDKNNVIKEIEASGKLIRLASETKEIKVLDNGIKLSKTCFGEPEGLPKEIKSGTFYIVSQLVKSALPNRADLLVPAEVIRDKEGNIIGCRSLGI